MTSIKQVSVAFLFAAVLLVPGGAFANSMPNELEDANDDYYRDGNKLEPDFDELPNPMAENVRTNLTDKLEEAHSDVTNIMIEQNETELDIEDYDGIHVPIVMTYLDEDVLVVGIDAVMAHPDLAVDPDDLQIALDLDIPIEIVYVSLESQSSSTRESGHVKNYKKYCIPIKPAYAPACQYFKGEILAAGGTVPTSTGTSTGSSTTTTTNTRTTSQITYTLDNLQATKRGDNIVVTWDRPTDFKVNGYRVYISDSDGIKYKTSSGVSKSASSYTLHNADEGKTYKFKVKMYYQEGTKNKSKSFFTNSVNVPRSGPVIDYTLDNLQATKRGDNIVVTWDRPTDFTPTKYKLYVLENGRQDSRVNLSKTATSYTFTNVEEGNSYKFKVKMYYLLDNRTKNKSFYTDIIEIPRSSDTTPPVIKAPQYHTTVTDGPARLPQYVSVTATDDTDGRVSVTCDPGLRTVFPVGTTTVTCTATDAAGNTATKKFDVHIALENQCIIAGKTHSGSTCDTFDGLEQGLRGFLRSMTISNNDPVVGGSKLTVYNPGVFTNIGHGTVGIVLDGQDGKDKILTASHVVTGIDGPKIPKIHNNINLFGYDVSQNMIYANLTDTSVRHTADAALLTVNDETLSTESKTIPYKGQKLSVTSFGGISDMRVGTTLHIAGVHNSGSGNLQYHNATIAMNLGTDEERHDVVFVNQMIANYPSEKGDSGAPVFTKSGKTANLVGINVAAGCAITLESGRTIDLSRDHTGQLVCHSEDNAVFKVITPWENIVEELELNSHIVGLS